MLDIIAISYKNIWPFKENPISLFFQQGKYLIKAPIGTGKSFLFFDGPIYGLYKYNTRSLLNNQSKEGWIKILFTYEWETRLITRQITKAKVKESCLSNLYKIQNTIDLPKDDIIQRNKDIEEYIKTQWVIVEKLEFKNETDLQQTFLSFLPPKEVFVNTVFLMQDSDNIFELLPSERLTVLKNVFWLLGIDEAKEIIAEKKKEITYKLKTYSDTSKYNEKIKDRIKNLLYNHNQLNEKNIPELKEILKEKNDLIQEIDALQEKITIQDLDISIFSPDKNWQINTIIQEQKDTYKSLQNKLQTIQDSIKNTNIRLDNKRQNLFSIEKTNQELENNIKNIEQNNYEEIVKQKDIFENKLETIDQKIDIKKINTFWEECLHNKELIDFSSNSIEGIENLYNMIKQLIEKGKSLQEKIKNNNLLIQNKQLEQKGKEEKHQQIVEKIKEQLEGLNKQLEEINQNIISFEKNIEEQAIFSCEKIWWNCPFIKVINKKTFDQFEQQKKVFIEKKEEINQKIKTREQELQSLQEQNKETNKDNKVQVEIQEFKENIILQEKATTIIKDFLHNIDWKSIQTEYQNYIDIKKLKQEKEQELKRIESLQKKKEEYIQQQNKNKEIITIITKEIHEIEQEKKKIEEEKKLQEEKIQNISYQQIVDAEKYNNQCIIIQRDIENSINDFKELQRETEILKKQEKQIWNLYTIFSKELLLLVLEDHLPILNDIINNYLSQIVEYQIELKLTKSSSDKLELEANIIDQQWEREIKSLSWGQKIILKLIRMLSISSYMNSPLLFLDETINNLDNETVSKVADMLENFIKQKNIKFYTVTHNQQIQDMQIRDKTIEITR